MDYLPTLDETWPHSRGNVGKYSHPMEHLGKTPHILVDAFNLIEQY